MKAGIIAVLVLALLVAAVWYPGHRARQNQVARVLESVERLFAAAQAGNETEFRKQMVDVLGALNKLKELDPGAERSAVWTELSLAMMDMEEVWSDGIARFENDPRILQLSEVELRAPGPDAVTVWRSGTRYGLHKSGEWDRLLEVWAYTFDVRQAYLRRAEGRLDNAKVLLGRMRGELYKEPPNRPRGEWLKLLPIEHPARANDLKAQRARETQERAAQAAAVAAARTAAEIARFRAFPLRLEITLVAGDTHWLSAYVGVQRVSAMLELEPGTMKRFGAHDFVEFMTNRPADLRFTVNGSPWEPQWQRAGHSSYYHSRVAVTESARR